MSDDDIDLDRVIIDPAYRREVIDFLKSVESDPIRMTLERRAPADDPRAD